MTADDAPVVDSDAAPAFICECAPWPKGSPELKRRIYYVTGHDGSRSVCSYCDGCAHLALIDWTGETAKIEPVRP